MTSDAAAARSKKTPTEPDNRVPLMAATGGQTPGWPLQSLTFGCETLQAAEPQALALTYWFDAAPDGHPYPARVRFTGQRTDLQGRPDRQDRFDVIADVDRVVPGSGRISLTTRLLDVSPGRWQVKASPVRTGDKRIDRGMRTGQATATTAFAPVMRVRAPGVRLGAWPALVATGAVAAFLVQALLADRLGLPVLRLFVISLIACLVGLVGAKIYYLATNRGEKRGLIVTGMCIQGFVIGAVGTVVLGGALTGIPVGRILDATAPGLMFGMSIGRLGCFFGGCCAGRPTASRLGLWSSDRRLGVRRIPVQLMESSFAATIGLASLLVVWFAELPVAGLVFVAAIASYTAGRQVLFPLRGLPRQTTHGRSIVLLATGLVAVASIIAAVVASL